jgi:hypothetical protein
MTVAEVELLRLYIDDKKDGTEKFNDDQLQDFIDRFGEELHAAAAEIWGIKAARVTEYYLTNIDGSFLSRNQVFDHCMAMADFHRHGGSADTMESVQLSTGNTSDSSSEF